MIGPHGLDACMALHNGKTDIIVLDLNTSSVRQDICIVVLGNMHLIVVHAFV